MGPPRGGIGRDDLVRVSPPGFGAPPPDGWPATYLDYRDWLEGELTRFDAPVDLVGHDWGGGHVLNVVMHRPELVRSWVSDVVGVFGPATTSGVTWPRCGRHPSDGEQLVDSLLGGTVQERAERMATFGIPLDIATLMAPYQGPEMVGRSCCCTARRRQPAMAEAGRELEKAAARPGLSLLATEDHYGGSEEIRRRAAERAGARTEVLEGLGHWWMVQDPARGAAALTRFWDSLD